MNMPSTSNIHHKVFKICSSEPTHVLLLVYFLVAHLGLSLEYIHC